MPTWVIKIVQVILGGLFGWLKKEKADEHRSEAKAARDALDSVGDSINAEKKVKDAQDGVDKEKVINENGDIDFNSWNSDNDQ
jgi:hypothetical protein